MGKVRKIRIIVGKGQNVLFPFYKSELEREISSRSNRKAGRYQCGVEIKVHRTDVKDYRKEMIT